MASSRPHISLTEHDEILQITVLDERLTEEKQVSEWREQMADAIRGATPTGVVIDMGAVEYLTSVAVFPLIATRAVAEQMGARMVLCGLSSVVAKVLTVAQLIVETREHAQYLHIAQTLDDAIEMLERRQ